jgi:hypothetical protein
MYSSIRYDLSIESLSLIYGFHITRSLHVTSRALGFFPLPVSRTLRRSGRMNQWSLLAKALAKNWRENLSALRCT